MKDFYFNVSKDALATFAGQLWVEAKNYEEAVNIVRNMTEEQIINESEEWELTSEGHGIPDSIEISNDEGNIIKLK